MHEDIFDIGSGVISIIVFVFGLITGSFLNVVGQRLPAKQPMLWSRSRCTHCLHELSAAELIPILSFLFQKGRCRNCASKISAQYPLAEIATAVVFLLAFWKWGLTPQFFFGIVLAAFLIVIFITDLNVSLILDAVTVPAIIIALLGSAVIWKGGVDTVLGMLIGGGFFLLQFVVSHGKWVGGGDVRLGVLMGAVLGWQHLLLALLLAYWAGAIIGAVLLLLGKKKRTDTIPFGTFLSAATITMMLYGETVLTKSLNFLWER